MGSVHHWPQVSTRRGERGRAQFVPGEVVSDEAADSAYAIARRQQAAEAATEIGADQEPRRNKVPRGQALGRFWPAYVAFLAGALLAVHIFARR